MVCTINPDYLSHDLSSGFHDFCAMSPRNYLWRVIIFLGTMSTHVSSRDSGPTFQQDESGSYREMSELLERMTRNGNRAKYKTLSGMIHAVRS